MKLKKLSKPLMKHPILEKQALIASLVVILLAVVMIILMLTVGGKWDIITGVGVLVIAAAYYFCGLVSADRAIYKSQHTKEIENQPDKSNQVAKV